MKYLYVIILTILFTFPLYGKPYSFTSVENIPQPCAGHASVTINGGKVFVLGGYGYFLEVFPVASNLIRVYDPVDSSWYCSRVRIKVPRMYASAIALSGGRILIVGGIGQDNKPLNSIELYSPSMEKSPRETVACKIVSQMQTARRHPVLNLIDDNTVLITGDFSQPEIVEIDDNNVCVIRNTANKMCYPRIEQSAVKMSDNRVCLISGRRKSIEIFDPETETFSLSKIRFKAFYDDQAAAALYDDRILIVGGQNIYGNKCSCQSWIFNPKDDSLIEGVTLTPTADGKIRFGISDLQIVDLGASSEKPGELFLLCGGEDDPGKGKDVPLDSAWLYNARSDKFVDVGPMIYPHDDFRMEMLPEKDGKLRVLIIGGHSTGDKITDKCEIFQLDKSFLQ